MKSHAEWDFKVPNDNYCQCDPGEGCIEQAPDMVRYTFDNIHLSQTIPLEENTGERGNLLWYLSNGYIDSNIEKYWDGPPDQPEAEGGLIQDGSFDVGARIRDASPAPLGLYIFTRTLSNDQGFSSEIQGPALWVNLFHN